MKSPKLGVISTFEWTETMEAPNSTRIYIPLTIAKKKRNLLRLKLNTLPVHLLSPVACHIHTGDN
jgi:hypothetical protein